MTSVYISITTNNTAANLFEIRLNESLSSYHVDEIFSVMSRLVNDFTTERQFKYTIAHSVLAELIGEAGNIYINPNLECRSSGEINVIMNEMIDEYEGLEFYILCQDASIRISSTEEGSTEKIKQYLC
jgi:hypothetical protein